MRARSLYRTRRTVRGRHGVEIEVDGRRCLNFCANDYLGLAGDARVAAAAKRALDDSGTGSGAAALVSGYNAEHRALEEELAVFVGRPRALLFSSGWAANLQTRSPSPSARGHWARGHRVLSRLPASIPKPAEF